MIWHVQKKRKRRAKARRNPVSARAYAAQYRSAKYTAKRRVLGGIKRTRPGKRSGGVSSAKTIQRLLRRYPTSMKGMWSTAGRRAQKNRIKSRRRSQIAAAAKQRASMKAYADSILKRNPRGKSMAKRRRRRYRRNPASWGTFSLPGFRRGGSRRRASSSSSGGGARYSIGAAQLKRVKRRRAARKGVMRKRARRALRGLGILKRRRPRRAAATTRRRRRRARRATTVRRRRRRAGRRPTTRRRRRTAGGRRMARRRRRRRTARNPWAGFRLVRGMVRAKRRGRPYKARRRHFRRQYRRGRVGAFAWRRAKRYGVNPSFRGIFDMVKTSVLSQALPTAAGVALGRFIGGYLPMVPGVNSVTGMLGKAADPVLSTATLIVGGIVTSKVGALRKFQPGIMTGLGLNVVYSLVAQFVPSIGGFFGLSGVYDTALAGYTADTAGYETVDGYETVGEYESVSGFEADVAGVEADLAGVSPFSRGYGNLRAPVGHRPAVAAIPAHSMTSAVEPWTPASDDDAALYGGVFGGRRVGW